MIGSTNGPRRRAAAIVLALGVGLMAPACGTGGAGRGDAGEESRRLEDDIQAVLAAHEAFVSAYEQSDVEGVVARFEPDAALLIFHPVLENRYSGLGDITEGLAVMFERMGDPAWSEAHPEVRVVGDLRLVGR